MNDRHVGGGNFMQDPMAFKTRLNWSNSVAVVLIVTFTCLTTIHPGSTLAEDQASGTAASESTGMQVGSWLLTVPYCVVKSAFAAAGSVVGGLGYVFSGGNQNTAETIWASSVYGTYIIRPAHLRGEEPIQFLGKADGDGNTPALHPARHASAATDTGKK
jgi:hypothetical protein